MVRVYIRPKTREKHVETAKMSSRENNIANNNLPLERGMHKNVMSTIQAAMEVTAPVTIAMVMIRFTRLR